jgi:hypothetical protein
MKKSEYNGRPLYIDDLLRILHEMGLVLAVEDEERWGKTLEDENITLKKFKKGE